MEKLVAFNGKDNLTLCGVVLLRWELREGIGKGWLIGLIRYILPYYTIRLSRDGDAFDRFYESPLHGEAVQESFFPKTISASEWGQVDLRRPLMTLHLPKILVGRQPLFAFMLRKFI